MTDKIVVFSTCGSADEAEKLARILLEARLAACVSVLTQNRSFYRWKDKIEDTSECLLIIKTSRALFDRLSSKLGSSHSYSVPEIVALPVIDGAPGYLAWMDSELQGSEPESPALE
jgi:periplasmic divalent cation tolerance protein